MITRSFRVHHGLWLVVVDFKRNQSQSFGISKDEPNSCQITHGYLWDILYGSSAWDLFHMSKDQLQYREHSQRQEQQDYINSKRPGDKWDL